MEGKVIIEPEPEEPSGGNGGGGGSTFVPSTDTESNTEEITADVTQNGSSDTTKVKCSVTTTVENGKILVAVSAAEDAILNAITDKVTAKSPLNIAIALPSESLAKRLSSDKAKSAEIVVSLSGNILGSEKIVIKELMLSNTVLTAAKDSGKTVSVAVKDTNGRLKYRITLSGADLKKAASLKKDMNCAIAIKDTDTDSIITKALSKDKNNTDGILVNMQEISILQTQAKIKVYVRDLGIKAGQKCYMYRYNPSTKKLDLLPTTSLKADKLGYVTANVLQGGKYVILEKKPSSGAAASLQAQVSVKKEVSLKKRGSTTVALKLPVTLQKVTSSRTKATYSAARTVTVKYSSTNPKVVSVNAKTGKVTAKESGKATIKVIVKFYDGKEKTYTTTVIVK